MTRIAKTFTLEAGHRLQRHDGKCWGIHGHSYRIEVSLEGFVQENDRDEDGLTNPSYGMVIDFGRLKRWWKEIDRTLDHALILEEGDPAIAANEPYANVFELKVPPTAENIAAWILNELQVWLIEIWPQGFPTPHVRVWETDTSWAEA